VLAYARSMPIVAGRLRLPSAGVDHDVRRQGLSLTTLGVAHAAHVPVVAHDPLHGAVACQRDVGMPQGTLLHAVFEEPAAVAGDVKPEIARLSDRARHRKRFAGWEVEHHLRAGATPHRTKRFQLLYEARI
jgi:hypothetical protein